MLNDKNILKRYLLFVCLVVGLCMAGLFLALALRNKILLQDQLIVQARANFRNIVLTRQWIAQHGGVYVFKRPGVESNPYLEHPDLLADDGRVLTLKNPALMTREISELAGNDDLFAFRITSLNPLNPDNAPDSFESQSLQSFKAGKKEAFLVEDDVNGGRLRYMAPLMVDKSCLVCHGKQGYAVGQVRGGISVSFKLDEINKSLHHNYFVIVALGVVTVGVLLLILWLFFRNMQQRLDKTQALLKRMATTDALTNVANRASIMTRLTEGFARHRRKLVSLGCLMIDVDFFKSVNDNFGHQKGDTVLQELASLVSDSLRPYDSFGRYGGEEFLLVLDGADADSLAFVAERVRAMIEEKLGKQSDLSVPVTVSIGATLATSADQSIDDIILRADLALYEAKDQGRNRVVLLLGEDSDDSAD
ncbi:diguanylate cyclase (GGDEF) domain-containing protein [Maridesulfovibrio ferrireducens]|uniref:diguanylate cyclase n=1 Tax=Maridesulfovibrio ferrireducens TaxID=246191 RepID=A0A1G9FUW9_9BACT|nr:diguanylate cyclase [Maridesulfovibrio ferrireducens]SDK92211.1 diguanylate cyclase (GGDEF) domain-containing protein [Maridesulfovibrio ferrireducens]